MASSYMERLYGVHNSILKGLDLESPLPSLLNEERYKYVFKNLDLVPFMGQRGDSVHSFVDVLYQLFSNSIHQASVIKSIANASFGGTIRVAKDDFGFDSDDLEVSEDEKNTFISFLTELGMSGRDLAQLTEELFRLKAPTSNVFMLLKFTRKSGQTGAGFSLHTLRQCVYIEGEDNILFTEDLAEFNANTEWRVVSKFRSLEELEFNNGYAEAFVHIRENKHSQTYYDKPIVEPLINDLLNDWQMSEIRVKGATNSYSGNSILAIPEDVAYLNSMSKEDRQKYINSYHLNMNEMIKHKGKANKGLAIHLYDKNGEKPELLNLPNNNTHEEFKGKDELIRDHIYEFWGWSPAITGAMQQTGNASGEREKELFAKFNSLTVKPTQKKEINNLIVPLRALAEHLGYDISNLTYCIDTAFSERLKEADEAEI